MSILIKKQLYINFLALRQFSQCPGTRTWPGLDVWCRSVLKDSVNSGLLTVDSPLFLVVHSYMSVPCLCKDFDMRPVRRSRLLCTLGVCIAIMFLLVPTSR